MRRRSLSISDQVFIKDFGRNLVELIRKRGYSSIYEFWIEEAGDHISRAALNRIATGTVDVKISTIRILAKCLKVKPKDLLDF